MSEQAIKRSVDEFSKEKYDLIIVGGGIYGVMLSLEASRRRLRSLLLEQGDFVGQTSRNHLRTVHGGIRYLQSLDLTRFRDSVGERKWFLKHFPAYVKPMPCLMPLYNKGRLRKSILRLALLANDLFSFRRNVSVAKKQRLPRGKILSRKKTKEIFAGVDEAGLKGGAVWHDASLSEFQRLFMAFLKLSCAHGAAALNYVRVTGLSKEGDTVLGVKAKDEETGDAVEFRAPVVINAAGPWVRDTAKLLDHDYPRLFKKRLLLWNVLFDRPALSKYALGLNPVKGCGHTYFFHPWKERLLVGTGELPLDENDKKPAVPDLEMAGFIRDLNRAVPDLHLGMKDIVRVYAGVLPAEPDGKFTARPVFIDHGQEEGTKGLYSISGVKFTTARLVADRYLGNIFPHKRETSWKNFLAGMELDAGFFGYDWQPAGAEDLADLRKIIDTEAVVHLGDLILRRTSIGDNPARALTVVPQIRELFDWDDRKWQEEIARLERQLNEELVGKDE